jgi:hypothetical protein
MCRRAPTRTPIGAANGCRTHRGPCRFRRHVAVDRRADALAVSGSAKRRQQRVGIIGGARRTAASFFARASAILSACLVTHTPDAFTHERPPLFDIDSAITSMYCSQSVGDVGTDHDLAVSGPCTSTRPSAFHRFVDATVANTMRAGRAQGSRCPPA